LATPNIVPRADNEGSLGVSTKQWADIQAKKFNGKAQASTNTSNTVVIRDASGNFSAGTITAKLTGDVTGNVTGSSGSCTGNAATATKLATTRALTIGSTAKNFDGSAAVTWSLAEIGAAASSHTHTIANVTNLQTTLNGKAASGHTHSIANVSSLQTTLDGKVPTGRTVTAGNGLTGGGALSGNITVTMGTPGSCSTSTPNAVTATSHTHTITGVAAASHTHSYAPIPTSSTLPVGASAVLSRVGTGAISNNATAAGSSLYIAQIIHDGNNMVTAVTQLGVQAGTWKNISGTALSSNLHGVGLWVRIA
jgi:hypothetical protein